VFTELVNSRIVGDPEVVQMGIMRISTGKSACVYRSNPRLWSDNGQTGDYPVREGLQTNRELVLTAM